MLQTLGPSLPICRQRVGWLGSKACSWAAGSPGCSTRLPAGISKARLFWRELRDPDSLKGSAQGAHVGCRLLWKSALTCLCWAFEKPNLEISKKQKLPNRDTTLRLQHFQYLGRCAPGISKPCTELHRHAFGGAGRDELVFSRVFPAAEPEKGTAPLPASSNYILAVLILVSAAARVQATETQRSGFRQHCPFLDTTTLKCTQLPLPTPSLLLVGINRSRRQMLSDRVLGCICQTQALRNH